MESRERSCSCDNIDSEFLEAIERHIDTETNNDPAMLSQLNNLASGCGYKKVDNKWVLFPEQLQAISLLGSCGIVEEHGDGDLTMRCNEKLYVVTTEGKIFGEIKV